MITLKTKREIELMRQAGKIVAELLEHLKSLVGPGVETGSLDRFAEEFILRKGAIPAFKGYNGFPASICTSVNDEVVHGIPGARSLSEGDIISIDVGVLFKGYYGDAAITLPVGEVDEEVKKLLKVTEEALYRGIQQAWPGVRLGKVSHAIQSHVEKNGFSVVRDYVGHGIGTQMHEDPAVPNFGRPDRGIVLKEGMTLAIEPMVNAGSYEVYRKADNWTVATVDGKYSAHFEHSIVVSHHGPEILTRV